MKLASFIIDGRPSHGLVVGDGVIDAGRRLGGDLKQALSQPERLVALQTAAPDHALGDLTLLPPIPNPGKIICVGVNYLDHIREIGREPPAHPSMFLRFADTQVGHGQPLVRPPESEQLDFEGELALVIGRACRRIAPDQALCAVAGYACYNDGSVRDWQFRAAQVTPGKNFPSTGGFGPWLVTADEVGDPATLTLTTRVNGVQVQRGRTADMLFDLPTLVAYCATFTRLERGDVIVTGTPAGVGMSRRPPLWLKPGDLVEVEISRIGVLANPVRDEDP